MELNGRVKTIVEERSGSLLIGGSFDEITVTTAGGTRVSSSVGRLYRVHSFPSQTPSGSNAISPPLSGEGADGGIEVIQALSGGRIAIGGSFGRYDNERAHNFAVLNGSKAAVPATSLSIVPADLGLFHFRLNGEPGRTYRVQSLNLQNWKRTSIASFVN